VSEEDLKCVGELVVGGIKEVERMTGDKVVLLFARRNV
jgi:hypothetical protein